MTGVSGRRGERLWWTRVRFTKRNREDVAMTSPMALEGLRVIDVSTILAGPLCCQILGDFGADVIKIEHPTHGDGMRGHGPRQGRRAAVVEGDLPQQAHRRARPRDARRAPRCFRRLVATADVLVENFRPGTLERWGLGPDELHEVNPGLVVAADHRLRPDRSVRRPRRLRHARRGDERLRAPHRARPTGRRRCRRSAWPTASAGIAASSAIVDGAAATATRTAARARSSTSASSSRS